MVSAAEVCGGGVEVRAPQYEICPYVGSLPCVWQNINIWSRSLVVVARIAVKCARGRKIESNGNDKVCETRDCFSRGQCESNTRVSAVEWHRASARARASTERGINFLKL